jgi:hypothetical protein
LACLTHKAEAQIQEELSEQPFLIIRKISLGFHLKDSEQVDHMLGGREVFLPLFRQGIRELAEVHECLATQ